MDEKMVEKVARAIARQKNHEAGDDRYGDAGWHMEMPTACAAISATAAREMVEALEECAEDLEAYVRSQYEGTAADGGVHPAIQRKYERDMEPVHKARAALLKSKAT